MDVQRGHCWRCEEVIAGPIVHCKLCWIAVYCSTVCCVSDAFRHAVPECELWGPKTCSNPQCDTVGHDRDFLECPGCADTRYCKRVCQQEHWSVHQNYCMKRFEDAVVAAYFLKRHFKAKSGKPMPQPYYIGNALAIDMLNLKANECATLSQSTENHPALNRDYSILSVGCGNLRNFIHTVASLPNGFQGKLHTTLNDYDPFVQARNVLFLFMMISNADNSEIASLVTTIWYSLHLSTDHFQLLIKCLRTLADITRAGLIQSMRDIVDVSEKDLNIIRQVWKKWLGLECRRRHSSYINLQKQRQELFRHDNETTRTLNEYKQELKGEYSCHFDEWLRNGIFLPTVVARERYLKYGNPTLTGFKFFDSLDSKDACHNIIGKQMLDVNADSALKRPENLEFAYCIPSDLHPFGTWDHLLVQKFSLNTPLIEMYHRYITDQIQQVIARLNPMNQSISFNIGECTDKERNMLHTSKFDRIFTSNIADYIGTQKLLSVYKHDLNRENKFAVIVTQYWNWYLHFPQVLLENTSQPGSLLPTCVQENVDKRAILDTGMTTPLFPGNRREYFNSVGYFISYLRADFATLDSLAMPNIASFKDVKESEGLRMRDFRRELNNVVPFQYRRNTRQVNMLRGDTSRMVEWYIP